MICCVPVHETVIEAPRSSNQVRNSKRDHAEARFHLKEFTIEEGTKVKIKNIQYIQLSVLHLFFCIKEDFFTSSAWTSTEGQKGGPWLVNVFFDNHSYLVL